MNVLGKMHLLTHRGLARSSRNLQKLKMKNLHPDQHHPTPTTPTPTHLPAKQVRRVSQDFKHKLKIFQQEQHADKNNESTESTESKWANNHPETKANREISNSKAIQDATSNLHNVKKKNW